MPRSPTRVPRLPLIQLIAAFLFPTRDRRVAGCPGFDFLPGSWGRLHSDSRCASRLYSLIPTLFEDEYGILIYLCDNHSMLFFAYFGTSPMTT
jgi:hypothetical protein